MNIASKHRGRHLDSGSLGDLVRNQNALAVEIEPPNDTPGNAAALWIGDDFIDRVQRVGMTLPPLPRYIFPAQGGRFALGAPDEMFVYLDRWVQAAFDKFRSLQESRSKASLAELMQWALPADHRTLAATWQSAANAAAELDLQLRVFAKGQSASRWRRTLQAALDKQMTPLKEVVVFTGPTGSEREHVFNEFVIQSKRSNRRVVSASFRDVVVEKARMVRPHGDFDKLFLMRVGQRVVERSPLFMVARSLDAILAEGEASTLIVDSVRHRSVLEAIQWILPIKVTAVGVHAAPKDVTQRLTAEHYDEREIQDDPTEKEIPDLVKGAAYQIDTTKGEDWKRKVEVLSREVFA